MGVLRLLLAVSVMVFHLWRGEGTAPLPSGSLAVQAFFIISGFYMSLILTSDVYAGKNRKFWLSRLLRIFPVYWVLAAASALLTYLIAPEIYGALWAQGFQTITLVTFTNVFIVGQDVRQWLVNIDGTLTWTTNVWSYPPPLIGNFAVIGPAWTLALELSFYALAPFLVQRRTSVLVGLIVASLIARFVGYAAGLDHLPWTGAFFPFELAFFLLGVVAHRMTRQDESRARGALSLSLLVAVLLAYQSLPQLPFWVQSWNDWAFLLLIFFSLPSVFRLTEHSKIDAALGELSYPLYLSHMVVAAGISGFGYGHPFWTIIAITFFVSAFLAYGVDRPLSRFRHSLGSWGGRAWIKATA